MTMKEGQENINNPYEVLWELFAGIIVSGLIGQLVCLFFPQTVFVSVGWWMGVVMALFMAWHMFRNISNALDLSEGDAISSVRFSSVIRYGAALLVMLIIFFSNCANGVAYTLGIFTLKAGAYMQPLTHKIMVVLKLSKPYPKGEALTDSDNVTEEK